MSLKDVPFGTPEEFNVVIEISQGSRNKFEYDENTDTIKLDRVLYGPQRFPFNYGFIPHTRAQDGDHTDAAVLSTDPLPPGIVVACRAIGFIEMIDSGEVDNKIVSVPVVDPRFSDIKSLDDLPEHFLKEVRNFLETYKVLQGKTVEIKGFAGADRAIKELKDTKE